jgi:membrane protein DedA with SNARE-associated domain
MSLSHLVETHGYWVLAVGCLFEGETMLLLAGYAVHRGLLHPWAVLSIAAGAGFTGDEIFFWIGRRHGAAVLARWPSVASKTARVRALLLRYHEAVIVFVRFAYGLRAAGPMIIGMTPVPGTRFAFFNAIGAVLWACIVGAAGWWFGEAAAALLGDVHEAEGWTLLALGAVGALAWLVRCLRRRRRAPARDDSRDS